MIAMAESPILTEIKDSVLFITMNRPSVLNAIDATMGKELYSALRKAESDSSIKLVVLTGQGRAFTVGEDLNENKKGYEADTLLDLESTLRNKYNPIILAIRRMSKLVVAGINGVVAGAGLGIALACDLRFAAESSTFHMAFSRVGLIPDSGTVYWLVKSIGLSKASELCFISNSFGAREALQLGLINGVIPDNEFKEQVEKLANRLSRGPVKAFELTKKALNKALFSTIDDMLDYEAYLQGIAGRTKDHIEGVKAFFEKREPIFSGE